MSWLELWFRAFWALLLDTGLWLVIGFAIAGIVHALVPPGWIQDQLGPKRTPAERSARGTFRLMPILKAAALGVPLPLCSCSVIPVAASIRQRGASRGATAAFAISTPQTGEESIPLTWAMFGPVFAIIRPVAAVATAVVAGTLIDLFARERDGPIGKGPRASSPARSTVKPCCADHQSDHPNNHQHDGPTAPSGRTISLGTLNAPSASAFMMPTMPAPGSKATIAPVAPAGATKPTPVKACCASGAPTSPAPGWSPSLGKALRYGFVTLPRDIALWLLVGLVLAATVAVLVPADGLGDWAGGGVLPMLAMLGVGIPLYICATSSTPLAFTLVAAGVSPGAALVLLLAGPATNTATLAWAFKALGGRGTAIYLASIAAVALAFGLVVDALAAPSINAWVAGVRATEGHAHAPGPIALAGAVALVGVLAAACVEPAVRSLRRVTAARLPAHSH